MQIVDRSTDSVVEFEPGLTVEIDFIADCVRRILDKGVGVLKTQEHVAADIRSGIEEAILALKLKVTP